MSRTFGRVSLRVAVHHQAPAAATAAMATNAAARGAFLDIKFRFYPAKKKRPGEVDPRGVSRCPSVSSNQNLNDAVSRRILGERISFSCPNAAELSRRVRPSSVAEFATLNRSAATLILAVPVILMSLARRRSRSQRLGYRLSSTSGVANTRSPDPSAPP